MLLTLVTLPSWQPAAARQPFLRRAAPPRLALVDSKKQELFTAIEKFDAARAIDGTVPVDFGVKGGELDEDSRAPKDLASSGAFYAVSQKVGEAADGVLSAVEALEAAAPQPDATRYFGTLEGARLCPLDGAWLNIFTTAADATFSKDSKRGDARVYNVIDAKKGGVTNVIDFLPAANATKPPVLEQFRVSLTATALSPSSLSLVFRCVRIRLTRLPLPLLSLAAAAIGAALAPGVLRKVATLFGGLLATALAAKLPALPLPFGLRTTLTLPVPGPFLTRILFAFRKKEPPKAIVDFLFLDDELRVQRTNQGNIFVQRRAPAGWGP